MTNGEVEIRSTHATLGYITVHLKDTLDVTGRSSSGKTHTIKARNFWLDTDIPPWQVWSYAEVRVSGHRTKKNGEPFAVRTTVSVHPNEVPAVVWEELVSLCKRQGIDLNKRMSK